MKLPRAAIERIMRNAGAEHVTEDAVDTLQESTTELGEELARDALQVAREHDRTRIEDTDIEDAITR